MSSVGVDSSSWGPFHQGHADPLPFLEGAGYLTRAPEFRKNLVTL